MDDDLKKIIDQIEFVNPDVQKMADLFKGSMEYLEKDKCKHENTETEGFIYHYYLDTYVINVTTCLDCEEIIEEKETKL